MTEVLRIAICEDTPLEEEKLLALINENSIPTSCTVFTSGEDLLNAYQPQDYDLLLIDIYMGGITGIATVTKIRAITEDIPVFFITTSLNHTLEAYRLSALKYIEKPYQQKAIDEILELAQLKKNNMSSLVFQRNGKLEKIPLIQIVYLEQQNHQLKCFVMHNDKNIPIRRESLSKAKKALETFMFDKTRGLSS